VADFQRFQPQAQLDVTYARSGEIATARRAVDVFFLCSDHFAEQLLRNRNLRRTALRPVVSNWLVLAVQRESSLAVLQAADLLLPAVKRVGVADWEATSLGYFSRQALEELKLWEPLQHKVQKARDDQELARHLAQGRVAAALLYSSSVAAQAGITAVAPIPERAHRPILYFIGTASAPRFPVTANMFVNFTVSARGQQWFQAHEYRMLNLR